MTTIDGKIEKYDMNNIHIEGREKPLFILPENIKDAMKNFPVGCYVKLGVVKGTVTGMAKMDETEISGHIAAQKYPQNSAGQPVMDAVPNKGAVPAKAKQAAPPAATPAQTPVSCQKCQSFDRDKITLKPKCKAGYELSSDCEAFREVGERAAPVKKYEMLPSERAKEEFKGSEPKKETTEPAKPASGATKPAANFAKPAEPAQTSQPLHETKKNVVSDRLNATPTEKPGNIITAPADDLFVELEFKLDVDRFRPAHVKMSGTGIQRVTEAFRETFVSHAKWCAEISKQYPSRD